MVDLRSKPYYLSEEDIQWVKATIEGMSIEEKIGQLFFHIFDNNEEEYVKQILTRYKIGGARYITQTSEEIQDLVYQLQSNSKIPMLVAANLDAGGNGACSDGTYVASAAQVEATGSEEVAYNTGLVSGREATALGVNWNFGPCGDILFNWRNTIINTRAYGSSPKSVIKYISAYIKGLRESNIASCLKHFPGDGVEERDQHLLMNVNTQSVVEWEESFGSVYRSAIDEGISTIMAGHIALPEYQKKLIPDLEDKDILPASLAPELINDLLKSKLGFNGLVVTDSTFMIGLGSAMRRQELVPKAIAAGCDMFLFFNDLEEDFQFMLDGYLNGVITGERLQDALERILGLKAALKLHTNQKENTLLPKRTDLEVIGCKEHLQYAKEAADLGITLVKNTKNELPIRPSRHKRIKLYTLYGEMGGILKANKDSEQIIIEELERVGFEVTLHKENESTTGNESYKGKTLDFTRKYDAVFVFSDVQSYATQNNVRINWGSPTSNKIPWYVHEVPTVFVSLNYTTHLTDVPMVKTYINAYKNEREIIRQTISKIMGESEFKGSYNENVFCDKWDTRL